MPWSAVLVEMHHADLEPFVGRVDLDQEHRNIDDIGQILSEGKGQFDALVNSIVPHPPFSHAKLGSQFVHVVLCVLERCGDGTEQHRVVVAEHFVGRRVA